MINKLIKLILATQIGLFMFNVCNYLMLLNTEHYKFFLQYNNKNDTDLFKMFNNQWSLCNVINVIILILTILIVCLYIAKIKKDKE